MARLRRRAFRACGDPIRAQAHRAAIASLEGPESADFETDFPQSTAKSMLNYMGALTPNLIESGSPGRIRTSDPTVNSRLLYRLSYRGARAKLLESLLGIRLGHRNQER